MSNRLDEALAICRRVFGHRQFVGKQAEVISHLLNGGNALALMPTGGGKSLCYQVPALVMDGTAIIVSPLIALMQDQVESLQQYGVRAEFLNSALSASKARKVLEDFGGGMLDLLYVSPERLMNDTGLLQHATISLIAIDEAHCVSQWGHDFRPEYLRLGELANITPQTPRLALTATADKQTKREIIDKLGLQDALICVASFDRPNIRYAVRSKVDTRQQFLNFYRKEHNGQSGIIYCLSRKRAEETAQWLEKENINALPYHAGIAQKTRQEYQNAFLRQEGMVMCATIAFGMGIDKPDVRFVAHFDLPKTIEAYYQETGRAGRDGLPANALLFYGLADVINIQKLMDDSKAPAHIRRIERQKLNALLAFCEASGCRRTVLLNYFGESYTPPCGNCDNCLTPPETWDGSEAAKKFLSAVYRTRQMFGANHIIDVLTGKESEKVKKFRHTDLPTFGVGKDINAAEWRQIARQMIAAGWLIADGEYGGLKLSPNAKAILCGEEKAMFRREPARPKTKRQTPPPREKQAFNLNEWEQQIFGALREERRRLSERQNVPAYIIFHDTVLIALARSAPETAEEFANIPGVGKTKAERYASYFIKVIKSIKRDSANQHAD